MTPEKPMRAAPSSYEALRRAIAEDRASLSRRLAQIADLALEDPSALALGTASSIAERTGVAASAVIRFAQAFGYSGFSEMQAVFRQRFADLAPTYRDRIRHLDQAPGGSGPGTVMDRFIDSGIESLRQLQHATPPEKIEAAARIMADARIVHLIAQRRTYTAAYYLGYNLARLEVPANLLDGTGGTLDQQMVMVAPEDAVVAISFRPNAPDTIGAFTRAQQIGARTIAIVDIPQPPFNSADALFEVEEARVEEFRSLTATMSLALILAIRTGQICAARTAD